MDFQRESVMPPFNYKYAFLNDFVLNAFYFYIV
jgi:hypothetical protein